MLGLFRDPIWTFIGVIVAIYIGLLTLYYTVKPRRKVWLYLIGALTCLLIGTVIGATLGSINPRPEASSPPPVALISLSYEVGDYDPRRVDLRTVSTSGIPVTAGKALRLFDLWFSTSDTAAQYMVQAEIYANGQIIGSTTALPLIAGQTKLGDVKIKSFADGDYPTSWNVQQDWKDLQVYLITYLNGKAADRSMRLIHLAENGTAWFIDPPYISLYSIVYSVNDGPGILLDFRDAETVGLKAGPGDTLTIEEIWYDSINSCQGCTVQGETTLLAAGEVFNQETDKSTDPTVVQKGIHKLIFTPLRWTIPPDKQSINLTLYRNDKTVMDGQTVPLK